MPLKSKAKYSQAVRATPEKSKLSEVAIKAHFAVFLLFLLTLFLVRVSNQTPVLLFTSITTTDHHDTYINVTSSEPHTTHYSINLMY
jgi:hypothetical protein